MSSGAVIADPPGRGGKDVARRRGPGTGSDQFLRTVRLGEHGLARAALDDPAAACGDGDVVGHERSVDMSCEMEQVGQPVGVLQSNT